MMLELQQQNAIMAGIGIGGTAHSVASVWAYCIVQGFTFAVIAFQKIMKPN